MTQAESAGLPKAIVVTGAGTPEANGVYKATTKEYCNAPIYEHTDRGADLKITREPHTNPKTGATKHGWLLGLNKKPLYGAPTEALAVPTTGWKKFNGEKPIPTVKVHDQLTDVFFEAADESKTAGDQAVEEENWALAEKNYTAGIDSLKKSGERFGDPFKNRAALLLARRANANVQLKEHKAALRDAITALDLVRGIPRAEKIATDALKELGCSSDAVVQKILESVGTGRLLDSQAPLVLRCIDRWVKDIFEAIEDAKEQGGDVNIPEPRHMAADRYLPDLDDKTREEIIKKYVPGAYKPFGGTAVLQSANQTLQLMRRWEEVFMSDDFKKRKDEMWDNETLSYTMRIHEKRNMIAGSLKHILEPMGYAAGRPGLSRCVKQMQQYWSNDPACAHKALELEELADISLADLESHN